LVFSKSLRPWTAGLARCRVDLPEIHGQASGESQLEYSYSLIGKGTTKPILEETATSLPHSGIMEGDVKTDTPSKVMAEAREVPWRPWRTAAKGAAYAAITCVIVFVALVVWAAGNDRLKMSGDAIDAMILRMTGGALVWGACVGFFCARLPKRFGAGVRLLWMIAASVAAFLVPYVIIIATDPSANDQGGAIGMSGALALLGLILALVAQFAQNPPQDAQSQVVGAKSDGPGRGGSST
jgi:hypothetical protein